MELVEKHNIPDSPRMALCLELLLTKEVNKQREKEGGREIERLREIEKEREEEGEGKEKGEGEGGGWGEAKHIEKLQSWSPGWVSCQSSPTPNVISEKRPLCLSQLTLLNRDNTTCP